MIIDYQIKFAKMRTVGKFTTQCLDELTSFIKPGISTEDINLFVKAFGENHKLINAQYNYRMHGSDPFPGYACTSLNEAMCHQIPSAEDILNDGDIIKVDITFIKDGYHGDACRTYPVGRPEKAILDFIEITKTAKQIGIQQVYPGNKYGNIGKSIEEYCKHNKVAVAHDFVGHGIGTKFHDFPQIIHHNDPKSVIYNHRMSVGDTFTIEPIIISGHPKYKVKRNGWTTITKDHSLAAQFESTVGVTENGYEEFCK